MLDPWHMCTKPDHGLGGLKNVSNAFIAAKRLSDYPRDTVLAHYTKMLQTKKQALPVHIAVYMLYLEMAGAWDLFRNALWLVIGLLPIFHS